MYETAISNRADPKKYELMLRTAISRAYYGAFHESRAVASTKGILRTSTQNAHQAVSEAFRGKPISNHLDILRKLRTDADYELNKNIAERDAQNALKLTEKVLQALANV